MVVAAAIARAGGPHPPEVLMSAVRTLTLADAAWPRAGTLLNLLLIVAASALTATAAQVAIPVPWSPVPITGQTFAVLLSGALLGPRRAFLAQALYLAEGACGLPVFAGGAAGLATFAGPTGGYLAAFPFAPALTGFLAARGWDRSVPAMAAAMLLGSVLIFVSGLAWLSRFVPGSSLLSAGLVPLLPPHLGEKAPPPP